MIGEKGGLTVKVARLSRPVFIRAQLATTPPHRQQTTTESEKQENVVVVAAATVATATATM